MPASGRIAEQRTGRGKPSGSLALQLFIGVFVSSAGLLLVLSYVSTRRTTELWTRSFEAQAANTGAMVERALTYAMLLNRKDELHESLRNIAREPSVVGLRIYDKNGRTMFSTEADEVGRRVRKNDDACISCHPSEHAPPLLSAGTSRIVHDAAGREVLARIQPIANQSQCSTASCHAHSADRSVLGVLDLRLSVAAIRQSQDEARRSVVLAGLLLGLLSAIGSAWFIRRFVRRPVQQLALGARNVAAGKLDTHIEVLEPAELRELALTFNEMTRELERARQQSERWEEELSRAVAEKTESLSRAQQQLERMERMASLGKLAATVAHELNNPLAGILVYAKLVQRELAEGGPLPESRAELVRYLEVIRQESARCGDIVKGLLTFARDGRPELGERNLNEIVERSLLSVRHRLEQPAVECQVQRLDDGRLICDGNQLQQALVALLVNAVEAMPQGGRIEIRLTGDAEQVRIEVADTGAGIPAEVLPHIFEPFVSTKHGEKGVGLGLAVVYGIVHRHGGTIDVNSTPEHGSVFRLTLPRLQHAPAQRH